MCPPGLPHGAPSVVTTAGAARQDGGAKPAAAELGFPATSRTHRTCPSQLWGTQGPYPWCDPGSVRWRGSVHAFSLPLCFPPALSRMATASPLEREVGESAAEKVPFLQQRGTDVPGTRFLCMELLVGIASFPYGHKGKKKKNPIFCSFRKINE